MMQSMRPAGAAQQVAALFCTVMVFAVFALPMCAAASDTGARFSMAMHLFGRETHIREPYACARHLASIEEQDTVARLLRRHRGLKIDASPVWTAETVWTTAYREQEASAVVYTYYLPIEQKRKLVAAYFGIADDSNPDSRKHVVRFFAGHIIDMSGAGLQQVYRVWQVSADTLAALLAQAEPVYQPENTQTLEHRMSRRDDIYRMIVDPTRMADCSDTKVVVVGADTVLTDPLRGTRQSLSALADTLASLAVSTTTTRNWYMPTTPYVAPSAVRNFKSCGPRLNPLIYLHALSDSVVVARIITAHLFMRDDALIIRRPYEGYSCSYQDVVLCWLKGTWQGYRTINLIDEIVCVD